MPRSGSTKKARASQGTSQRVTSSCDVRVETKKQHTRTEASQLPCARYARRPKTLTIFNHDLDNKARDFLIVQDSLAIDTETDGLDPRRDALRLVTICTPSNEVFVIQNPNTSSIFLSCVLSDGFATKIFHHAFFDLCFIKAGLGIDVRGPIECTKVLMKMLHPELPSGLGNALKHILKIQINKKIDHKDWRLETLSARQKEYISNDTLHLHNLARTLRRNARYGTLRRYADAISVIRLKASIEMEGYIDLFEYPQAKLADSLEKRTWWAKKQMQVDSLFTQGGKSCSNRHLC